MDNEEVWFNDYKSKQGNIGLGQAIAYYMSKGYMVALPVNDTQPYDLVIDKFDGKGLQRVSVKTTRHQADNLAKSFVVKISSSSGMKRSYNPFNKQSCDLIFIYTINQEMWEIPSSNINSGTMITLNENLSKYRIK